MAESLPMSSALRQAWLATATLSTMDACLILLPAAAPPSDGFIPLGFVQVITVATISEKLKVNGSLARRSIDELAKRGLIKCIVRHSGQRIYTKTAEDKPEVAAPAGKEKAGKGKGKAAADDE